MTTHQHPFFFIRHEGRFVKIAFEDIHYIEACRNYCKIYAVDKWYFISDTLIHLETFLPRDQFCRIHRSFVVALDKIESFTLRSVHLRIRTLPIGDTYVHILPQRVAIVSAELFSSKNRVVAKKPIVLFSS